MSQMAIHLSQGDTHQTSKRKKKKKARGKKPKQKSVKKMQDSYAFHFVLHNLI